MCQRNLKASVRAAHIGSKSERAMRCDDSALRCAAPALVVHSSEYEYEMSNERECARQWLVFAKQSAVHCPAVLCRGAARHGTALQVRRARAEDRLPSIVSVSLSVSVSAFVFSILYTCVLQWFGVRVSFEGRRITDLRTVAVYCSEMCLQMR